MATITHTVQSSELSRNSREVFEAADKGPVLITRRDGEALVLTKASQADDDRKGLELASALVAASLAPGDVSFLERLRTPFPWLALLAPGEQEAFAKEIVDVARGCASVSRYDQLLMTLHAWVATAEAVAAGYTPDDELQWLEATEAVADPRG
ncbi:MAG: type II toxin-antitoxin system Phd/YefM family antitoxin [Dermatophilaceae bacterium]